MTQTIEHPASAEALGTLIGHLCHAAGLDPRHVNSIVVSTISNEITYGVQETDEHGNNLVGACGHTVGTYRITHRFSHDAVAAGRRASTDVGHRLAQKGC